MKYINNISLEEFERIEQFLTNELQEDETRAFENELQENRQLKEKTEELKLLLLGINESSLEEKLKSFHNEIAPAAAVKKNAGVVPLLRKILVAASILAVVALPVFWFLQKENGNEKLYSRYYTTDPGLATVMSGSSDYIFNKAMVEYKNGEYDKALTAWQNLLKTKPGNDTLYYFIGATYQARKELDLAIESFQKVTTNNNSLFYKDACWYLGLSYLKQGELDAAKEYIEKSGHPHSKAITKSINTK